MFGERDNETFNIDVDLDDVRWTISMQYNYDLDGDRIEPMNWCVSSFKHNHKNHIADRSEEELDQIIEILNQKQTHW